jgi:hypothetical protein
MKWLFKYGLMALLLVSATPAQAGDPTDGMLGGIFYQPWREDLSLTKPQWEKRMLRLRRDGLETLYLQWLQYGEADFLNAPLKTGEPFIKVLLDTASNQGIGIHMGLFSDPEFFKCFTLPPRELETYLLGLREKNLRIARQFQARYGKHPAFSGWYLCEEIDDLHWQSASRRKILNTHIRRQRESLRALNRDKRVAFSTFFSGALSSEAYALFCRQLLEGSDHLVMVQGGLGSGRADMTTTRRYHEALNRAAGKHGRLLWIVELFNDELPGPGFRGKAITHGQLNQRLAILNSNFRGKRLVAFSLRYWLDEKARLSRHYRSGFHKPGPEPLPEVPRDLSPNPQKAFPTPPPRSP